MDLNGFEVIAREAIAKLFEHKRKHEDACLDCPFIMTRREYFFTKRYIQKMFNMKTHSKLMYLYGVRILRCKGLCRKHYQQHQRRIAKDGE